MDDKLNTVTVERKKIIIVSIVIIVLVLIIAVLAYNLYKSYDNAGNNNVSVVLPEVNGAAGILLTGREKESALKEIGDAIKTTRSKAIMLTVEDSSESSPILIYNSSGEIISEDSSTGFKVVFLQGHKAIIFGDRLGYGYDSDVISVMECVYELARDYNLPVLRVYEDPVEEDSEDIDINLEISQYFIDIRGWDAIRETYNKLGGNFGDTMVNILKSSIESLSQVENADLEVNDDTELNLRLTYIIGNNEIQAGMCYVYTVDKPSEKVTWMDMKINWSFDGILDIPDWKLRDRWYSIPWEALSTMTEETGIIEIEQLFMDQYQDVVDLLNKVYKDNKAKIDGANRVGKDAIPTIDIDGNAILPILPILDE